ncbi:MAG TPA: ABC transporter ATP-binding protein [Verrucomicrobiae bacterium]|nr:ABC transporter ATP-binding protein [Verrucomicrobiae bacterium]
MTTPAPSSSSEPGAIDGVPVYDHLLEIRALRTFFFTQRGVVKAVHDVSLHLDEGEVLGLVGESGCGKTMTALSILKLVDPPGRIVGGEVRLRGRDLLMLREEEIRRVRGRAVSMIFQEAGAAMNPMLTVGFQIAETAMVHLGIRKKEAMSLAVKMLEDVRIPDAARRSREYPHQLSGGMKQRAMIAMALVCRPSILIADEPTTALDVTIQAEILDLLARLREEYRLTILLITHDLGVVAEIADRVAVMYAGKIVEEAAASDFFREPRHPYSAGLLRAMRKDAGTRAARRLAAIEGAVPDLLHPPAGCLFSPRCGDAFDACAERHPPLVRSIGAPSRGPAAVRAAASPEGALLSDAFPRKVACFQFDALPEAPRSPDGAGWDAERGR